MIQCPENPEIECAGPQGEDRWWKCPVHKGKLTAHWTRLCRNKPPYRLAWKEGRGPGQEHRVVLGPSRLKSVDGKVPRDVGCKSGPGTELKQIIAAWQRRFPWFDLGPQKDCGSCADMARKMDQWGPDGCKEHMETILDRLDREAAKRNLSVPFQRTVARLLVKQAIRRALNYSGSPPAINVAGRHETATSEEKTNGI